VTGHTNELATRAVSEAELDTFFRAVFWAFGVDPSDDELAMERITAEPERTIAVFDDDEIVATAGAFTFAMTAPGGRSVPTAGVTFVGVRPTHRRRGVLAGMMARQLHDVHDRGEPIAALWASEAAIYGRFGYGLASQLLRVEVDRVDAGMRTDVADESGVHVRLVAPATVTDEIERIDKQLTAQRPGSFGRDKRWIEMSVQDPQSRRQGRSSLQCFLAEEAGRATGYALYRTKGGNVHPYGLPDGEVAVGAQAALTPAANTALTRSLLSLDLMRRVKWWNLPVDATLPHLLRDPRHVRTTLLDALHVRIVDLPAALVARRYLGPFDVVLDVSDALCPWNDGRWHLVGGPDGATCERTDAAVQLTTPVESLGAAYLGGTSLATLAATGRVSGDADTVAAVATAFGSLTPPWCPTVF